MYDKVSRLDAHQLSPALGRIATGTIAGSARRDPDGADCAALLAATVPE